LSKYKKAPTKPKKPKTRRKYDPKHPHVSTAKEPLKNNLNNMHYSS
jgi:hypothetical protein